MKCGHVLAGMLIVTSCATNEPTEMAGTEQPVPGGRADGVARTGTLLLWQGFTHDWERRVVGFRVPHRISHFENYLTNPTEDADGTFVFAQNTGVDGNYMNPVGRYVAIESDAVEHVDTEVALTWSDEVGEDGSAGRRVEGVFRASFDSPIEGDTHATAVLRGLSLKTRCDDAKQPAGEPCNSNGIWPWHFDVSVGNCQVLPPNELECVVAVHIERAWTPRDGGIPGIEVKPLNAVIDFDATVHVSAISAPADTLTVGEVITVENSVSGRSGADREQTTRVEPQSGVADAAFGIRRFGFTLARSDEPLAEAGRYIGGLSFGPRHVTWRPGAGAFDVSVVNDVIIPDTVVNTDVATRLELVPLQFTSPGVSVSGPRSATSFLCLNSKPEAPALTRWTRCSEERLGRESGYETVSIAPRAGQPL